jgi:hypothetical protein
MFLLNIGEQQLIQKVRLHRLTLLLTQIVQQHINKFYPTASKQVSLQTAATINWFLKLNLQCQSL